MLIYPPIFAKMTYLIWSINNFLMIKVDLLLPVVVSSLGLVIDQTGRRRICKLLRSMRSEGLLPWPIRIKRILIKHTWSGGAAFAFTRKKYIFKKIFFSWRRSIMSTKNPIHLMVQSFKVHFIFLFFLQFTYNGVQVSAGEKTRKFGERRNFPIRKLLLGD